MREKKWLIVLITMCLINLFFTTARVSFLSFLIGFVYFLIFFKMKRDNRYLFFLFFSFVLLLILIVYRDVIVEGLRLLLLARGEGSASSRSLVYYTTLKEFWERPVFGWGTERDVEGLGYPAGSHSHYLGILYKQGLLGFITFVGIYISLWFETKPSRYLKYYDWRAYNFLCYGRWIILAVLINSFTDVLDLDATTYVIIWIVFSMLLSVKRIYCARD